MRRILTAIAAAVVIGAGVAAAVLTGGGRHAGIASRTTTAPPSTTTAPLPSSTTTAPPSTTTAPLPSSTTTAAPARHNAPELGVNVNLLFNNGAYTGPQIVAQLQGVAATGSTIARSDALWEATEPEGPVGGVHHYDWAFDDIIAAALAAHGLTWLPILDYSAPWAQSLPGVDHSPPRSDADYTAYAGAFAARYGPGGAFWQAHPQLTPRPVTAIEIWNEPDNPQFWKPRPDAAAYAGLYEAARTAIDAARPGIRTLIGGLTDPRGFLPALVAAVPRLRGQVDGMAIHPYGRSPAAVLARVRTARRALDLVGMPGVPLWVTEFGWVTSPSSATAYAPARQRPADIEATVGDLGHLACGLAAVVLYTWVTPEHDPGNAQDWFGIANPGAGGSAGGVATADTRALAAGIRAASTPGASLRC